MRYLSLILAIAILAGCATAPATTPIKSTDVVKAFQEAGLEAENPHPMTKDDYGMAPLLGEGTRFFLPSLGENHGGRVIVGTPDEAAKLGEFYRKAGEANAAFFTWSFVKGGIVIQINGDMPEEQAKKYGEVLEKIQ